MNGLNEPFKLKVSIIIQAQNEEQTIGQIINEAKKINPFEIIVVVNGSSDHTSEIVRLNGCKLIEYKEALGINLGKAIGAYHATGDIYIFLDGDIVVNHKKLLKFVETIANGADIALNDLDWIIRRVKPDAVSTCKKALNHFLERDNLLINAMGAIPNALNKKALDTVGWWNLVDPPMVQAIAGLKGLTIKPACSVEVIGANRYRPNQHAQRDKNSPFAKSTSRIIGDHLQALHFILSEKGFRGGFKDGRDRGLFNQLIRNKSEPKAHVSAVIDMKMPTENLFKIVETLKEAGVLEIVAVGVDIDLTIEIKLKKLNTTVINLEKPIGLFMTRTIGTLHCTGETILFVNDNDVYEAETYQSLIQAIESGADLALNNRSSLISSIRPIEPISTIQYCLNIAIKRPKLANHSLVNYPHAVRRGTIDTIGLENFSIPPLAYILAVLENLKVMAPISVSENNDWEKHYQVLLGDHLEAIEYYLQLTDHRGGFTDGAKNRDILERIKEVGYINEKRQI